MHSITVNSQTGKVTSRKLSTAEIATIIPSATSVLNTWRAEAVCTSMQGILTLGKINWDMIMVYRETATWAEQVVIDHTQNWHRNSQTTALFAHILGFTDEQLDELFRVAMEVS